MPTKANRAIGSLDFTDVERRRLAIKSRTWKCDTCGLIKNLLKHPKSSDTQEEEEEEEGNISPVESKASTSRLESIPEGSSPARRGSNSDQSDCDHENSQSDSQETNADSRGSDAEDSVKLTTQKSECRNLKMNKPKSNINDETDSNTPALEEHLGSPNNIGTNQGVIVQGRRASIVIRSIFTMLFLLVLRRVIMLAQA